MKKNEQTMLVLSYEMNINGKAVTIKRLWNPDAKDAKENIAMAFKEKSCGFITLKLKLTHKSSKNRQN